MLIWTKQPGKSRRNVGQKFSTLGLKTKNFTHVLVYAVNTTKSITIWCKSQGLNRRMERKGVSNMNIRTIIFIESYMRKIGSSLLKQGKYIGQIPSEIIMLIEQMLDFSLDLQSGFHKYKWPQWMIEELLDGHTASITSARFKMCSMEWRIILKLNYLAGRANKHPFVQVCLKAESWDENEMDYAIIRIKSQCVETNDKVIIMERYSKDDDS